MELGNLIEKLARCHVNGRERSVFLLARDGAPFDPARDKDIWSLVGPVPLTGQDAAFRLTDADLHVVQRTLAEDEASNKGTECSQVLYLLVRQEETESTTQSAPNHRTPSDKDVWSMTYPMGPDSLAARFFDPPRAAANHAKPKHRSGPQRPPVRRNLLISLQNPGLGGAA